MKEKILKNFTQIYFIGIGGIGMSALALWFKFHKKKVAGYDKIPSVITDQLSANNINVFFDEEVDAIPKEYRKNESKKNTLIIYTPAIPTDHKQLRFFVEKKYGVLKRAQVLGLITKEKFTIAVAGTHGKTTTSSMIAFILSKTNFSCTAFLGGIDHNFNSNFFIKEKSGQEIVILEADEYDRSFLNLNPDIAIITSIEADHLDIYGSEKKIKESFLAFTKRIKNNGKLLLHERIKKDITLKKSNNNVSLYSFGIDKGDFKSCNISISEKYSQFDFVSFQKNIEKIKLYVSGFHNIENITSSIAVALLMGVFPDLIKQSIENYQGLKRRFEYIIKTKNLIYIDDYAHHPTEISALLKSVKKMYPNKTITVIFQPHLFSRTRDFAKDFAKSLEIADKIFLMDIYPARELPIEGVESKIIFDLIDKKRKYMLPNKELLNKIKEENLEILITMGAGNIDTFVPKIKALINSYT